MNTCSHLFFLILGCTGLVSSVAASDGDKATCGATDSVDILDKVHFLQTRLDLHYTPHGADLAHVPEEMNRLPHIGAGSRSGPRAEQNGTTADDGNGKDLDCSISFKGLNELLATDQVKCAEHEGSSPCQVNIFNPSFSSTHSRDGKFYGHARLIVVRNCSCKDSKIKRFCVNDCLKEYENKGLRNSFWGENFVDGTFGGWLNPFTCSFQVDALSFQHRMFDWRDFGSVRDVVSNVGAMSTFQMKEIAPLDSEEKEESVWTYLNKVDLVNLPLAFSKDHIDHMRPRQTRIIYSDASGPCVEGCSRHFSPDAVDRVCNRAPPFSEVGPLSLLSLQNATFEFLTSAKPVHPKVQEKNWSPFTFMDQLLFAYTWQPLRVCKLERRSSPSPCNFCHEISSTDTSHATKLLTMNQPAGAELEAHLNGLPLIWLNESMGFSGYLGVGHVVSRLNISDDRTITNYTHVFFRMSSEPPFQILDVSAPLPLQHAVSSAVFWSDMKHDVDTSFVSGFSLVEKSGQQNILLTYGSGDDEARLLWLPLSNVLELFPKPP